MNLTVQFCLFLAATALSLAYASRTPTPPKKYHYHVAAVYGSAQMDTTIDASRPLRVEDMPEVRRVLKKSAANETGVESETLVIIGIYPLE